MGSNQSVIKNPEDIKEGFHVLMVEKDSNCYNYGILPYFDFIIALNSHIFPSNIDFVKEIQNHKNKTIIITVYRHTTKQFRVTLTEDKMKKGLLGATIINRNFDDIKDQVWHIIDVINDSPAKIAGLEAQNDYIIGLFLENGIFKMDDIFSVIENNINKKIKLIIYNSNLKTTRECEIIPTYNWNIENIGNSLVGFDLAQGSLHQISDKHLNNFLNNISENNVNKNITKTLKFGGIVEKAQLDCHMDFVSIISQNKQN